MHPKNMKPEGAVTAVAFAVIQQGNTFTPTRLEIEGGIVRSKSPCGPAGPYKPLAYRYLAGAVESFFRSRELKAAHESSK